MVVSYSLSPAYYYSLVDCLFTAAFLSAHFDVCIHSPLAESLPKNKSDFVQKKRVMAVRLSKLSVLRVYKGNNSVSQYPPRIVSHVQWASLLSHVTCKCSACIYFVCMSMCKGVAVCVWMCMCVMEVNSLQVQIPHNQPLRTHTHHPANWKINRGYYWTKNKMHTQVIKKEKKWSNAHSTCSK